MLRRLAEALPTPRRRMRSKMMQARQVQRKLTADQVERILPNIKLATACRSSPGVGSCIAQPWPITCVERAFLSSNAAYRPRCLMKPFGSTVKDGRAGDCLTVTHATLKRFGRH
jgi:hypothetical protein